MGFEKFEKHSGRGGQQEPMVSLRQSESIGVNSRAVSEYFEDVEFITLYYDEEDNRVGLKPSSEDDPDAYKVQTSSETSNFSLNAAAFLKRFNLVPEQTRQYPAKWHEDEELVYIDLDDEFLTYGGSPVE